MKRYTRVAIPMLAVMTLYMVYGYAEEIQKKSQPSAPDSAKYQSAPAVKIPKLIDLGSKSCIPCKAMAPILDSLREEYKGKAEVVFIDVKEDRKAALEHKITLIPTQIFFDTAGTEVFRHIGFFPADSISAHLSQAGAKL